MDPQALGRYLRESRETREIRLDDAVASLKIRRGILESFEEGNFDVAETDVQVRGLLRNYARYLQLDESTVLSYYEAAQQEDDGERGLFRRRKKNADVELRAPRKITDTPPSLPIVEIAAAKDARNRTMLTTFVQLAVGLAALMVVIFIGAQLLTLAPISATPEPTTEVVSAPGTPTATYTATWTPLPPLEETLPESNFFSTGVVVEIELLQRSWMRIIADGVEQFSGIATTGEAYRSEANQEIQLSVANAAAVRVTYNGSELQPLGVRGQQVEITFTPSEMTMDASNAGLQPTQTPAADTSVDVTPTDSVPTPIGAAGGDVDQPAPTDAVTAEPTASSGGDPDMANNSSPSVNTGPPTPTPLPFAQASPVGDTGVDAPTPEAPSDSSAAQPTEIAFDTATPTTAVTPTLAPTNTGIPTATAILPPRSTPSNLPTAKP
ncbi:MAG: DUF4115 domain-containing protein [Anaerolineaceae bacterium]|nr:DUF4115 domain-containing protein [Anaerolineaceae bacterium]